MTTCSNCGRQLSCSCQERIASNQKRCCSACLQAYELKLNQEKANQSQGNPQPPKHQ